VVKPSNHIVVQKFGGTSLANPERVFSAAQRIINTYNQGNQVVAVVSAQGSTTDQLLSRAKAINPHAGKREVDMLLCTGEIQSSALLTMAIQALGYCAVSLFAPQAGIISTNHYNDAKIDNIHPERIVQELQNNNIVIVTGFQGITPGGDMTTLGRGASDTTAVALSVALGADVCEILTDVDGIYTADPRLVANAIKKEHISYDEMLALASSGVQKPHHRAVEMARTHQIKIYVRSATSEIPGTWIIKGEPMEQLHVSGLAIDRNIASISVSFDPDYIKASHRIFSLLAKHEIHVDTIIQTTACAFSICFTVNKQDISDTLTILNAQKQELGITNLIPNENLARVTIVGEGMSTSYGVAATMLETLYENNIDVAMISTTDIKISVLVDETEAARAVVVVHERFREQMQSNQNNPS